MFFLISGFIIAIVSLDGPGARSTIGVGPFFRRRFIRIVPLMWIAIVSFAVTRLAVRDAGAWVGYGHALLLWPMGDIAPTHLWTLRAEALFYIVFALTMLHGRRVRPLILLWIAAPLITAAFGLDYPGNMLVGRICSIRNLEFGVGLALALLWLRRPDRARFDLPGYTYWIVCLLFGALVWTVASWTDVLGHGLLRLTLMVPGFAALLWFAVGFDDVEGWVRPFGDLLGNAFLFDLPFPPVGDLGILEPLGSARAARGLPRRDSGLRAGCDCGRNRLAFPAGAAIAGDAAPSVSAPSWCAGSAGSRSGGGLSEAH